MKGKIGKPVVDKFAEANVKDVVKAIKAERPKTETLADKVKQVLQK